MTLPVILLNVFIYDILSQIIFQDYAEMASQHTEKAQTVNVVDSVIEAIQKGDHPRLLRILQDPDNQDQMSQSLGRIVDTTVGVLEKNGLRHTTSLTLIAIKKYLSPFAGLRSSSETLNVLQNSLSCDHKEARHATMATALFDESVRTLSKDILAVGNSILEERATEYSYPSIEDAARIAQNIARFGQITTDEKTIQAARALSISLIRSRNFAEEGAELAYCLPIEAKTEDLLATISEFLQSSRAHSESSTLTVLLKVLEDLDPQMEGACEVVGNACDSFQRHNFARHRTDQALSIRALATQGFERAAAIPTGEL